MILHSRSALTAVLLSAFLFSSGAVADKAKEEAARAAKPPLTTVGHARELSVVPDLKSARVANGARVWSQTVMIPEASFVKVHLVNVNLRKGDELVLRTHKGRVIETITGMGPKDMGTFWGLSSPGDTVVVELRFQRDYKQLPFTIDRVIAGDPGAFGAAPNEADRSICSPGDFQDAICFQGQAGKWANVQGSVGVMTLGGNATTSLFCSGSNVSPNNYVLTNQHCVETQAQCDNSEYVFQYYNTNCGGGPTSAWVSYRCDTIVAQEPFISCDAGPGDLDYILSSVIGDPASTFGWVTPDPTPMTDGEEIYIVQHPAGRPHEITEGSGADVDIDGSVFRYYTTLDTEGGSSGSPIFRAADDKLVGLHHCGGCTTAGVGNRGMLMSEIYPAIEPFLCTAGVSASFAGVQDVVELSGNGDSILDPGETWEFTPLARNASCTELAAGVSASFAANAGSADVTLIDTSASFGDITAGGVATSSSPVRFEVGASAVCGDDVVIDLVDLTATNGGPFGGAAAVVTQQVGEELLTTAWSEDFSAGLGAWTVVDGGDNTGAGAAATWTDTNPGARALSLTAPYAIVDSDEAGTSALQDEELISPVIDGSGYAALSVRFAHDFNWYSLGGNEQADVDIRSSATAGAWVNIANFSGADTGGVVSIDISAYAAADIQLRFHYYNGDFDWWWAIDDVTLIGSNGFSCGGVDTDGDGVTDVLDNCTLVANPLQQDSNGDGYGNICDADLNNDGTIDFLDLGMIKAAFFSANADADLNSDGIVDFLDLGIVKATFFGSPGPSGIAP